MRSYDVVAHHKPAKEVTTIRLAPAGRQRIAERAHRADVDFSHMIRRMLTYADQHMPEGWTPAQREPSTRDCGAVR